MKSLKLGVAAMALMAGLSAAAVEVGGMDETGPYNAVENFFKPGFPRWSQVVTGVVVDTPDRILIASADEHFARPNSLVLDANGAPIRAPFGQPQPSIPEAERTHLHQILALNAEGKVIEDWSQWNDKIVVPHNILISPYDKEKHVWIIDREGQQIMKFTNDGKKLVMTIGEKSVAGNDHGHFDRPAGMAFLPDGSFYVADGYRNTRVVKFDKDGKYLLEWGSKGTGPGQFNLVHSVAIDKDRNVYVADRNNNRIQIFDENGKYLREWDNIRSPAFLQVSADNKSIWVASNGADRLVKYDMNGVLQTYWGTHGTLPGYVDDLHHFTVAKDGSLFIADAFNNRLAKYVPKPDAPKARLVDQPFVFQ